MQVTGTPGIATGTALILRSRAPRGVSKDGRGPRTSWFETRRHSASSRAFTPVCDGLWTRVSALMVALFTMRNGLGVRV
jgi:hypothetical protein